jgi:hypothetical protein
MTWSRLATLLILLCVTLDLHDPSAPGVFFVQHDGLFIDAVTRPQPDDDAIRPVGHDRRSAAVRVDRLDDVDDRVPRIIVRDVRRVAWRPAARRAPSDRSASRDLEASA